MRSRFGLSLLTVCLGLCSIPACGDDPQNGSEVDPGTGATSTGGTNSVGNGGGGGTGPVLQTGGNQGTGVGDGGSDPGNGEACASANEQAALQPVHLVFLLDESGSMGDGMYGNRAEKWDPVTAALKSFFADEASAGLTASLSVFPLDKNQTGGVATNSIPADCAASAYVDPIVEPTELPNAEDFASAITALDPPNEFNTPTDAALAGTVQYAESLLTQDPNRKVAIVMVTDGEPTGCEPGNDATSTAAEAAKVADRIPTYVIGVGPGLNNLRKIAEGGGTEPIFVAIDDPDQTRTDLLNAINQIRGEAISCELDIPTPPLGKKLDPNKVDVKFTAEGAAAASLPYQPDCTDGAGWHYDDPAKPTQILLCEATCNAVRADANGKLDVVFGCEVRQVVN